MRDCSRLTIGIVLLCFVLGCSNRTETSVKNDIVIQVDDRVVTLAEFNEYFDLISMGFESEDAVNKEAIREARLELLLQLLEETIILRRADELDLDISPRALDDAVKDFQRDYPEGGFEELLLKQAVSLEVWKERLRKQLLVEQVMRQELLKDTSVTPQEIKEYFDKHRNEWHHGEAIRTRHILLSTEEEANSILERLRKGEDFASLARVHSAAPEAIHGGDMGFVGRGQLPRDFETALFDLEPGSISPVIKTPYGFHIFQVIEKRQTSVPSIEESIDRVKAGIQEERMEAGYGPWLANLRSRYHIVLNKEIIE